MKVVDIVTKSGPLVSNNILHWMEPFNCMVLIFILKYLSDFQCKTFQIWRSPEGPLMYVNEASRPAGQRSPK